MKEKEKELEKEAGVIKKFIVKGTINEPRIYPGIEFKPGQEVKVMVIDKDKKETTGLYAFLRKHRNEVITLRDEWNEWFTLKYPIQEKLIQMSRNVLFLFSVGQPKWDNNLLELLYIRGNLDLSRWSLATQINSLVSIFYEMTSKADLVYRSQKELENMRVSLYQCALELENKNITVKQFVEETIKNNEARWLKA